MENLRVAILDMQPIDPPVGGGRLRLMGLYSGFKNGVDATYVGSYDWRGPKYREHRLSDCLTEIDVPLSEEHFRAHDDLALRIGNGCIDTAFPMQGHLSDAYIQKGRETAARADVVIFSHPWVFPFIAPALDREKQLIVYDSHNVEGLLRVKLLDSAGHEADKVCREAVRCEYELCHAADLIFACSQEDKDNFVKLYDVAPDQVIIVPNGVFTTQITPCRDPQKKADLRRRLGITKPAACFIGSRYLPNEEAARLIICVADRMPENQFVLIGGVGESLKDIDLSAHGNVIITGFVEEQEKLDYLAACDIAINPMLSGSGTNIKMFDFMAAGLPIITTDIGARGIENVDNSIYAICGKGEEEIVGQIQALFANEQRQKELSDFAHSVVCEKYSWEQTSYELGYKLSQYYQNKIQEGRPFFSVVIPSYERHDLLAKLLARLRKQTFQDFEVIVVDQSHDAYSLSRMEQEMDILYFKTAVKGAAKARNTGIRLAKGKVVAFIDDDCIPDQAWLEKAVPYFSSSNVIGVEGRIEADIYDNVNYRVVSNVNFEGIGFMTANLFIRLEVLRRIDGFDESFDRPHFREDTDMAWRAMRYGDILYARDVTVLHPSHKRDSTRESLDERNKFYVHDPLLLKKHPEKFMDLFVAENHYKEDVYWKYFLMGMQRHKIPCSAVHRIKDDLRVEKKYLPSFFDKL